MNRSKTNLNPRPACADTPVRATWEDRSGRLSDPDRVWLGHHLQVAAAHLGLSGEVRVVSVRDSDMSAAHARYMDDPTTTDVLTFDMRDGGEGPLDTDILVCVDEAERQARERGHEARRELLLYAVHGVMHCTGHDDHDQGDYEKMHEAEDAVLEAIGVGATFHDARGSRPEPGPGAHP